MKLFGTSRGNNNGNLEIGNCDTLELANEFGTPLYVMDEEMIRKNCKMFKENFIMEDIETEVIYASKAFLNLSMCKLVEEENLSIDVVSGGELYTVLKANFPPNKIYMHGNNKTRDELILAINNGVRRIIVDNIQEIIKIENLCTTLGKKIDILLRVNPGIEAHTHEYIQTSKNDSKFGISIFQNEIYEAINLLKESENICLKGFHCHIGSQIFEENSFYSLTLEMLEFLNKIKVDYGFITQELNLGGGFGVYYYHGDAPIELQDCLQSMLSIIKNKCNEIDIKIPKIMIEPGRSIVANAGTTLYTVGGTKKTFGGKHFVFIDGGMTDNPRTALYDAKYEGVIANKLNFNNTNTYTIAGKCCESGDIIIKDIGLPTVETDDILAVFSTGAYNYSMSSNYNRIPKPAVIFVNKGQCKLVVKRETFEDIVRNDMALA